MLCGLKDELHIELIEYIDLFCILWLILHGNLYVYNNESYDTLNFMLSKITKRLNRNAAKYDQIYSVFSKSTWNAAFGAFIDSIKVKMKFNNNNKYKYDALTHEDYHKCMSVLGRDPLGLYSVIKRCTCKFTQASDFNHSIDDFFNNHHIDYERCCMNACVGIVSPFILSEKMSFNEDTFYTNKKLYSNNVYPLHSVFTIDTAATDTPLLNTGDMNDSEVLHNELTRSSINISSLLLDLIERLLGDDESISDDVYHLALIIKDKLNVNIVDKSPLEQVRKNNEDIIEKVNCMIPFPTLFWLIDKQLISIVSTMEGNCSISKLQDLLDYIINEYSKTGNIKYKHILETVIKDNLLYICRRFQLVHPVLLELLYNIIVNMDSFSVHYNNRADKDISYVTLSKLKFQNDANLNKTIAILNTLRVYGIGGSKNFFHIKCLHTNLAFELAEGSYIGNIISNKLH